MWSTENQEVLWKACENFDEFFSLFSWIFLTILSNPNRPKVSLAGLRMVSTSSCKNFRFFEQPSEKLCPTGMSKTTEMRQPLCILSPSFFFCFFDVTEGEKQGNDVDSVCGVIKREMVAALGFEWWKNTMQPATNDAKAHKFNNADYWKKVRGSKGCWDKI